ncbi:aminoglycoside phosphotransferase [Streptomyces sp. SID4919]|uniref:phosphotransferase n=1 Tax=unclassified Streptomyces TaxID=2593676 RepID=UPI001183C9CA|nr:MULTISPECIES: phosphotransferase [unclassified Streptomyces]MYY11752.1 aminoglycoside phosphotransferase [Streptomyces sp. SID4919]
MTDATHATWMTDVAGAPSAPLPSAQVLAAFGLTGPPVPLPGGQGQSVLADGAVLKPTDSAEVSEWGAELLTELADLAARNEDTAFRVPRPIRAATGGFVFDGWTSDRLVEGEAGPDGRWDELLTAGRAFHHSLRRTPRPDWLDRQQRPWAVADRVAWDETTVNVSPDLQEPLRALLDLRQPVSAPSQLIHGDLTGNVLFAPGLPPAVIDFSPYWRPVAYADAIVAADGLLHHGADRALVESAAPGTDGLQMLVRALIFRLVASAELAGPDASPPATDIQHFHLTADRVRGWFTGR